MFLSRLMLDVRSRAVRRDIADCQGLHRTVMSAFPNGVGMGARAELKILHRLEEGPAGPLLYVQSEAAPDWSGLPAGYLLEAPMGLKNPGVRFLDAEWRTLTVGDRLHFRLRANPTRRAGTDEGRAALRAEAGVKGGQRLGLRTDAERVDWLVRKGQTAGFVIAGTRMDPQVPDVRVATDRVGGVREPGDLQFSSATFDGALVVTAVPALLTALRDGVGSAKAYGFGLLSVAR